MTDTSSDNVCNFTTRYTYGNSEQEYVFSCRGRPFAALVSSNLSTPTSSLFDYDLIKSLGLKLTDLQCKKFFFAGNKFRILGRISTTVQCIQNGRSGSNFHLKGLVIADLNKALDTHCVAGHKMQQQLSSLCDKAEVASNDDAGDINHDQGHCHDDIGEVFNERKCKTVEKEKYQNSPTQPLDPRLVAAVDSLNQSPDTSLSSIDTDFDEPTDPATQATPSESWMFMINRTRGPHDELPPHLRKTGHGYCSAQVRTELPPNTCSRPSTLYCLKHSSSGDYDFWSKHALTEAERNILEKSQIDRKPRIVNVNADKLRDDMLRVGVWSKLDDPSEYQRRHVLIASLRRAAPGRVCQACSYMLQHSCPLSNTTGSKHCATCCEDVNPKVKKKK